MTDMAEMLPQTGPHNIDAREVARRFGVSSRTVRRLAAQGALAHYRIGSQVRFRADDVEEFLRRRRVTPS
ncbi:MAG: helix-turn-helix domain-containing protein [Acidimicrobiales bacterium]